VTSRAWVVRLAPAAEADLLGILRWTEASFGARQAARYAATIVVALTALRAGPQTVGARARDEVGESVFTLHVAPNRRKGRHVLVWRAVVRDGRQVVEVARILHDRMDLSRHIADEEPPGGQ
jgi:toxin ParE1/3/4